MSSEYSNFAVSGSGSVSYNAIPTEFVSMNKTASANSSNKYGKRLCGSEADLLSASNINSLEKLFRRKGYTDLPFISTFGMTTRETAVKKTMSMEGLSALGSVSMGETEVCLDCSTLL